MKKKLHETEDMAIEISKTKWKEEKRMKTWNIASTVS
jgi:hypothetical protein